MNTWEFAGIDRSIGLTNLNRSTVSSVKGIITAIKWLVFTRKTHTHTHIAYLIVELNT